MLSAKDAAAAVGLSKAGIIKAIKRGDLSASKDRNGQWTIDAAELFRVYPPVTPAGDTPSIPTVHPASTPVYTPPSTEVALLRELLAAKEDVIDDLRRRLDAEADERRRLTALITTTQPPAPRLNWWRRLWGK